jgi:CARDB
VWFEADVRNIGLATAHLLRTIQVDFRVNGTLVSRSNTYRSGLPAGAQITLRANTGPDGDQFWTNGGPGSYSIQARVDAPNRFPSEHSESNNTRTVQLLVEGEAPPPEPGVLRPSGPVQASANGQVIEGLDITATGTATGVRVSGFADVIVRNCRIRYANGKGIFATNAPRLLVEDVDVICTGAPPAGENPSSGMNCVEVNSSADVRINRLRGRDGSAIVRMLNCPRPHVSFLEGYDVRGPNPRGNLLQWDACHDAVLEDFSIINRGNVATRRTS